jgi:hypothetical protein
MGGHHVDVAILDGMVPTDTALNLRVVEGPEKATRGGVNGSQSKFLTGIWPMSQNQPDVPLY